MVLVPADEAQAVQELLRRNGIPSTLKPGAVPGEGSLPGLDSPALDTGFDPTEVDQVLSGWSESGRQEWRKGGRHSP